MTGEYTSSIIHQSRQHYGPTSNSPSYINPTSSHSPLVGGPGYDLRSPQFSQQVTSSGVVYTSSPTAAYPVVAMQDPSRNGPYYAGADFQVDRYSQSRGIAPAGSGMPRSAGHASPYSVSAPMFQNAQDDRYYGEQPPISQGSAYATNPDMYDRGASVPTGPTGPVFLGIC